MSCFSFLVDSQGSSSLSWSLIPGPLHLHPYTPAYHLDSCATSIVFKECDFSRTLSLKAGWSITSLTAHFLLNIHGAYSSAKENNNKEMSRCSVAKIKRILRTVEFCVGLTCD